MDHAHAVASVLGGLVGLASLLALAQCGASSSSGGGSVVPEEAGTDAPSTERDAASDSAADSAVDSGVESSREAGTCSELCNGVCVDVSSDRANCGACFLACGPTADCVAGACVCSDNGAYCSGTCVDLSSDPFNCGGCGDTCGVLGKACNAGHCVCDLGAVVCGGLCTDTVTDPGNCGACGTACPAEAPTCTNGACICTEGRGVLCAGSCVQVSSDPANCGACGHACLPGASCSSGQCSAYSVGGTITGLFGSVALQDNLGDDLTVLADGAFTFPTLVARGGSYSVTVLEQPSCQTCVVSSGSGVVGTANVTSVVVTCTMNDPTCAICGKGFCAAGDTCVMSVVCPCFRGCNAPQCAPRTTYACEPTPASCGGTPTCSCAGSLCVAPTAVCSGATGDVLTCKP